jgi:hypothetical protein
MGIEGGYDISFTKCWEFYLYLIQTELPVFCKRDLVPPSTPIICVPQHVISTKPQIKGQILLNIPIAAPQFIRAPDDGRIEPETCREKFE